MEYENIFFKPSLLKSSGNDLCWEQVLSPLLSSTVSVPTLFRAGTPIFTTLAEQIKAVISYVEEHYAQTITIEEMAAFCFFSKSYFMKFSRKVRT